jgi:hypothetical protein
MRKILLLLLLIILPLSTSQAAPADLYYGEIAVDDQSASERRRALPLALEHVFQKLSGLRQFEDYPLLQPTLSEASSILLTFYYRNARVLLADGSEEEELRLVAHFSEKDVDERVRELQLPLWQPERKPTVVWFVVDNGVDRLIMPLEFLYARSSMEEAARIRGLPIAWPSPDEEGNYPVDLQLLWGGYTEDLAEQDGDGVMILAARREGMEWGVRANLSFSGEHWAWRLNDIDLQAALTEGIHQAVDRIAAANAIAASDLGNWVSEITVAGLRGARDYQRCLEYLEGINVVEHVAVIAAKSPDVTFSLQLNAMPRYLEESLAAGGFLEWVESDQKYLLTEVVADES